MQPKLPLLRHLLSCALTLVLLSVSAQTSLYTVAQGDTLFSIAKRYNTTVQQITILNNLSNEQIKLGQELHLPLVQQNAQSNAAIGGPSNGDSEADQSAQKSTIKSHWVSEGETLNQLAQRYGLQSSSIVLSNTSYYFSSADAPLTQGITLLIPPANGRVVSIDASSDLLQIALQHDLSVAALAKSNGFVQLKPLPAGQLLYIPDSHAAKQFLKAAPVAVESSLAAPSQGYIWPIQGPITSYYGYRNISVGGNTFHAGIDISAKTGTPIQAAQSGTVSRSGWGGGYGYVVYVDHSDGSQTRYAHMSNMNVDVGASVSQGQVIGWVGSTGASTGPHLHFEIRQAGNSIDPLTYLRVERASR